MMTTKLAAALKKITKKYEENHSKYRYERCGEKIELHGARARLKDIFRSEILGHHMSKWHGEILYIMDQIQVETDATNYIPYELQLSDESVISDPMHMIEDAENLRQLISKAISDQDADTAVELTVSFMEIVSLFRLKECEVETIIGERQRARSLKAYEASRKTLHEQGRQQILGTTKIAEIRAMFIEARKVRPKSSLRSICEEIGKKLKVSWSTVYKYTSGILDEDSLSDVELTRTHSEV